MSKEIDEKVVSLEFDNSKFEKPAEQSMSTLDKLKASFNFKGISNGFDTLNQAIRKVTFKPMLDGVDTVYAKFTMMERFTIQLYDRMANYIINTGKRIANETFVAPITGGKALYEARMQSVQTIMAATSESLDTVNQKLKELNEYSDATIYSFQDMTSNIGKFTNAGVKLDDAVAAIKGVSNEAALSGATAAEASRAMYNFSQALSMGSVKIMDWKSIENANMATKSFKEELLKTGAALGTLVDTGKGYYKTMKGSMVTATQGFRDTLHESWLTSEVLIETLKRYADEEKGIGKQAYAAATELKTFTQMVQALKETLRTGWGQTWEMIIGNFEEAKQLWTNVSNELSKFIGTINDTRNATVRLWKENNGRDRLIAAIAQAWRNLKDILYAIRSAWRQVFPKSTESKLMKFTVGFERLMRALKPTTATLDRIKRSFAGFFSVLGIVSDAVHALMNALLPVFKRILPQGFKTVTGMTASIGDAVVNLRKTIKEGKYFEKFFGRVASIFEVMVNAFKKIFSVILDIFKAFKTEGIVGMFKAMGRGFMDVVKSMWNFVKNLHILDSIKNLGKRMANAIGDWPIVQAIQNLYKKVKDAITNSSIYKAIVGFFEGLVDAVQKAINKFKGVDTKPADDLAVKMTEKVTFLDKIKGFFAKVWSGIVAVFNAVAPAFKAAGSYIITALKNVFDGIVNVFKNSDLGDVGLAFAGAGLGSFLWNMAGFFKNLGSTFKNTNDFLKQATGVLKDVRGVLKAMTMEIKADALIKIAKAIGILAASLFVLAAIPTDALTRGLAAITTLFGGLVATMSTFNKMPGGTDVKGQAGAAAGIAAVGAQMLMIAVAVGILIADMAILAAIPYEALVKGISMLLLMMRALTSEITRMRASKGNDIKVAGTLIAFGLALKAIAKAIAVIAGVAHLTSFGDLLQAVGSVVLVMKVMGKAMAELSKINKKGTTKIPVAPLLGMIFVMKQLTLSIAILSLVAAKAGIQNFGTAAGVLVAAVTVLMYMFTKVIDLSKKSLGKRGTTTAQFVGLAVIIVTLSNVVLKIALAIALLSHMPQAEMWSAAGAISVFVAAFGVFMLGLGKISSAKKKAVTAHSSFTVILKNIIPTVGMMLMLSSAVVALSAAALVASKADLKGLVFVGTALALIATFVVAATKILGKGRNTQKGVDRLVKIVYALSTAIGAFALSVLAVAGAFAILSKASGDEIRRFGENLDALALTLHEHRHGIALAVGEFLGLVIETIFTSIAGGIAGFVRGSGSMIITALDSVIQNGGEIVSKIITGALIIMAKVEERADELVAAAVKLIIKVINALATAIDQHRHEITSAINNLFEAVSKTIVELFGRLLGMQGEELDKFVDQWKTAVKGVIIAVAGFAVINKIVGVTKGVIKVLTTGATAIKAFATGIGLAKLAVNEYGRKNAFGKVITQNVGLVTKVGTLLAKWATPIGVAIGLATTLAGIFKLLSSRIEVITDSDRRVSETVSKIRELESERYKLENERKERMKDLDLETNKTEELIGKLKDMIGPNGEVLAGYETQAKWLIEKINPALNTSWQLVGKRIQAYNDEGKLLDVNLDKTKELLKTQQLERRIDLMGEDYMAAKKQIRSGDLQKSIENQSKQIQAAEIRYYGAVVNLRETEKEYWRVVNEDYGGDDTSTLFKSSQYKLIGKLNDAKEAVADAQNEWSFAEDLYFELQNRLNSAQNIVDTYESAEEALMMGDAEAIDHYNTLIKNGINVATQNVPELIRQWNMINDEEQHLVDIHGEYSKIPDDAKENLAKWREVLSEHLTKMGGVYKDGQWLFDKSVYSALEYGFGHAYSPDYLNEQGYTIGQNLGKNVSAGANEALDDATMNGLLHYLNKIKGTVENVLEIGSPSKWMYRIGEYTLEGFDNAISDMTPESERIMKTAAATTLAAYQASLNNPSDRPTIVPMYDTSAIQNGSLLPNLDRTLSAGSVTARLAATVDTDSIIRGNDATVKEIAQLRQDVQMLNDSMMNLKVVMNSGALVGAIARDMDNQLGFFTAQKGKGV